MWPNGDDPSVQSNSRTDNDNGTDLTNLSAAPINTSEFISE